MDNWILLIFSTPAFTVWWRDKLKNDTRAPGLPIIRSVKSADSRIIDSQTRIPSRGVRSPIGPVFPIKRKGHKVVSLCTDDDILIEFIFFIFSLKTLGFWKRQVHWKPLSTRGNPLSLENPESLESLVPWNIKPLKPCTFREYWPLNPLCTGDKLGICLWLGYYRHMSWNPLTFGRLKPWVRNIWNPGPLQPLTPDVLEPLRSFKTFDILDLWSHEPHKEPLNPFYPGHAQGPWPLK